jgi:hypothetical protein
MIKKIITDNLFIVNENKKYGIFDKNTKQLVLPIEYTVIIKQSDYIYTIVKNNTCQLFNTNKIVSKSYDMLTMYRYDKNRYFFICITDKIIIINEFGKEIVNTKDTKKFKFPSFDELLILERNFKINKII